MNKEIKALWITALRSGEYTQGYGRLASKVGDEYCYCCLGVLCDLAEKAGVVKSTPMPGDSLCPCGCGQSVAVSESTKLYGNVKSYLPGEVSTWAEIDCEGHLSEPVTYATIFKEGLPLTSLAEVNDVRKFTFDDIADIIEKQF